MNSIELVTMMSAQLRYLDVDIKEVVVRHKTHPQSRQKDCYNNSWRELSDHQTDESRYVLGYLMHLAGSSHIPIEHAFIKHGKDYFDVTIDPKPGDEYISLVELVWDDVMAFVDKFGHAPDLYSMNRFMGTRK